MTEPYVNPLAAREPDLPRRTVAQGGLAHPRAEEALTFDECEEAGVDGTLRFIGVEEMALAHLIFTVEQDS